MKIGIIGYQGCGKSTLFEWLTSIAPDAAHSHETQAAMATVPDPRLMELRDIYKPKKVTQAALEVVDTPGLSRSHEGSAARLAKIREAGCLLVVVASYGGSDAAADLSNFEDDLLIADLDIVTGRVERLRDQVTKPRPNRDELQKELATLEPIQAALESGHRLRELELSPDQSRTIKSFQLFSEKPRFIVFNVADDDPDTDRLTALAPEGTDSMAMSLALQLELSKMEQSERDEFCSEMGVASCDRDTLIRQIMNASGQMLFFTAGDKEVRSWLIHRGGTAVEAAGGIHTDLATGFIRAEVMKVDDLVRLGSEREIKAHNLLRKEHKEYVLQDGDIVLIQHN